MRSQIAPTVQPIAGMFCIMSISVFSNHVNGGVPQWRGNLGAGTNHHNIQL